MSPLAPRPGSSETGRFDIGEAVTDQSASLDEAQDVIEVESAKDEKEEKRLDLVAEALLAFAKKGQKITLGEIKEELKEAEKKRKSAFAQFREKGASSSASGAAPSAKPPSPSDTSPAATPAEQPTEDLEGDLTPIMEKGESEKSPQCRLWRRGGRRVRIK